MAGVNSVVYVETEPGRFEIRRVVLGPSSGDQIVILKGVSKGEQVATRGNFLIDSQMQLAGNPSLIDPIKAQPKLDETESAAMIAALAPLSSADRGLVEAQRFCPVADHPLGSMGTPPKVMVNGTPVFLCCLRCKQALLEEPEKYLAKLAAQSAGESPREAPTMELPPIGTPQPILPQPVIRQTELPLEGTDKSLQLADPQEAVR
jgi:hypothetical protein